MRPSIAKIVKSATGQEVAVENAQRPPRLQPPLLLAGHQPRPGNGQPPLSGPCRRRCGRLHRGRFGWLAVAVDRA
jgi:hypothetical protein